jgi:molybdenum cofactor guanylyltransferase
VTPEIFVVGPDPDRYRDLALPVHADLVAGCGALGGIYTAVSVSDADRVLVVACDLPFLHAGLLQRLLELAQDRDGAWVETSRGVEPLLACYRTTAAPRIRARLDAGCLKAADLAQTLDLAVMGTDELRTFGPEHRLLANINSPDDYARVQYASS